MTKGKDYVVMDGDIILSMLPNAPAGIKTLIISQSKRELRNRNIGLPISEKVGLDTIVRSLLGQSQLEGNRESQHSHITKLSLNTSLPDDSSHKKLSCTIFVKRIQTLPGCIRCSPH